MGAIDARMEVEQTYTLEGFKEIADHGCQSGVCTKHIYYGDTIQFYETFETDILDELVLNYGYDFLVDLFKEANADLTIYKNHVAWAFIEMTAMEAVEDAELAPAKMLDEWNNSFEVIPSGSKVEALLQPL